MQLDPVCVSCTSPEDDPLTFAVSQFWKVVLHPDQSVPGALLLVSLRHVAKVGELDEREALEFFALYRLIEAALENELGASMVNVSCLRNWAYREDNADPPWLDGRPNPHVHWHVAPRYARPVAIAGDRFVDGQFGEELIWRGERVGRDVQREIIDRLSVHLGLQ
ncbi:MAG: hypothetical protein CL424_10505 [Acidimicrobiaceae bacterium]|nr:hypothetical protein [Acidimicrobiaceae bacterium]